MPRPADKPNKVGEHQVLKKSGSKSTPQADEDDDDARTERYPAVQRAFDESQERFGKATGQS